MQTNFANRLGAAFAAILLSVASMAATVAPEAPVANADAAIAGDMV